MRALKKDPNDRYQSAGEMGVALREYLRISAAAAGVHDLANFTQAVFAERARTKRRLLEEIRSGGSGRFALGVLKPETDESIPSRSEVSGGVREASLSIDVAEPLSGEIEEHPTQRVPSLAELEAKEDLSQSKDIPTSSLRPPPPTPVDEAPTHIFDNEKDLAAIRPPTLPTKDKTTIRVPGSRRPWMLLIGIPVLVVAGLMIWVLTASNGSTDGSGTDSDPSPVDPAGGVDAGQALVPLDWTDGGSDPKVALLPDAGVHGTEKPAPPRSQPDAGKVAVVEAETISVQIKSRPSDCKVVVDGVNAPASTPLENVELDAGTAHQVTVLCKNHKPQTKKIPKNAGRTVKLEFSPVPEQSKPASGTLRLDTEPWCEVYLGKRKLGITPLLGKRLPVGTHNLTLSNPQLGIKHTISVTILPGKTSKIYRKLSP